MWNSMPDHAPAPDASLQQLSGIFCEAMRRMMRMILPFRFQVLSVDGTWKLTQNKPTEVRARAANALAGGDASAQAIAALMREMDEAQD